MNHNPAPTFLATETAPSALRVAKRFASSEAESAAISLLQDAPDESVDDLIRMVGRARMQMMDPVSRSFVEPADVIKALERLRPEEAPVSGSDIQVYHATDRSTARQLALRGFIPSTKPRSLGNTYAPGRGIDRGLYVGATPRSVDSYGPVTVVVTVPKKWLEVPTELAQLGETSPMAALRNHDGAIVNRPIPADRVRILE